MKIQITLLVLFTDGAHLVCNNRGAKWDDFRHDCAISVFQHLTTSPKRDVQVLCATIAHHDHFHELPTQAALFDLLKLDGHLSKEMAQA